MPSSEPARLWQPESASGELFRAEIREQPAALRLAERDVLAPECQSGAVDRRQRRAQLVRDSRDELRLQGLDRSFGGEVAEGEDRSALEPDAGDREPELAPVDLDRLGLRP